ncbi:hypothetical protein [uncultured Bilophila sp.]|uniref:hypothetical protein n=1 Tax=uncultured Bilophila sp. TaxID=529385 RepID=UPI00266F21E8|nr:hypothetical protein [uncultured Bilophila sp.]
MTARGIPRIAACPARRGRPGLTIRRARAIACSVPGLPRRGSLRTASPVRRASHGTGPFPLRGEQGRARIPPGG